VDDLCAMRNASRLVPALAAAYQKVRAPKRGKGPYSVAMIPAPPVTIPVHSLRHDPCHYYAALSQAPGRMWITWVIVWTTAADCGQPPGGCGWTYTTSVCNPVNEQEAGGDCHRCRNSRQWACWQGKRLVHTDCSAWARGFGEFSTLSTSPTTMTVSLYKPKRYERTLAQGIGVTVTRT